MAIETKMSADMQALLEDASPWGKHAPVYKLAAAARETSLDALGEADEEDEDPGTRTNLQMNHDWDQVQPPD
jgi:hypothetical protein